MADHAEERRVPVILLIAGLAIYVVGALIHAGTSAVGPVLVAVALDAVVRSILLIIAAMLIGTVLGIAFGTPGTAMLKFAAITVASGSVAFLIGGAIGGLIGAAVFFSLVMWLFDIEFVYVVVLAVVYWIVGLAVAMILAGIARG